MCQSCARCDSVILEAVRACIQVTESVMLVGNSVMHTLY